MQQSVIASAAGSFSGQRPQAHLQRTKLAALLLPLTLLAACGSGSNSGPAPSQPNYPQTPPVPITWTPESSNLPAPPDLDATQSPLSTGSNDFPLTVSNPPTVARSPRPLMWLPQPLPPIQFFTCASTSILSRFISPSTTRSTPRSGCRPAPTNLRSWPKTTKATSPLPSSTSPSVPRAKTLSATFKICRNGKTAPPISLQVQDAPVKSAPPVLQVRLQP